MKSALAALLIVGFAGIAIFGIFAMSHSESDHSGCIAAATSGTNCPNEGEGLSFLNFHIETFRNFTTATFGEGGMALTIVFVLIAAGFCIGAIRGNGISQKLALALYRSPEELFRSPFTIRLNHWLALHENSPAIL
jgi:hypothetical protein